MLRLLLLSAVLLVTACTAPVADAPAYAGITPAVITTAEVADEPHLVPTREPAAPAAAVAETIGALVHAVPMPDPVVPLPASEPLGCPAAVDLIIAFEVASPEIYEHKYQKPIWPGAASGVTVGIGYDLGHTAPKVIAADWEQHPQADRLPMAAGVRGPAARPLARSMRDVVTRYPLAHDVFLATSLVEHENRARRAFGPGFERAPACVQGAITSVVFNRGASMTGGRRAELRAIRDDCLPRDDYACVAQQVRAMARLWQGTPIEVGMRRRREAEARLIEQARG
jgi:hypothetical protein